jgi:hypothetical protein
MPSVLATGESLDPARGNAGEDGDPCEGGDPGTRGEDGDPCEGGDPGARGEDGAPTEDGDSVLSRWVAFPFRPATVSPALLEVRVLLAVPVPVLPFSADPFQQPAPIRATMARATSGRSVLVRVTAASLDRG